MNKDVCLENPDTFYREAFKRNIGLLTDKEQETLRKKTVAIVGLGGVGGSHLLNLVRLGVGSFHIADMDSFELANIQRQCAAFIDTLGRNKAEALKEKSLSINPHLTIKEFPQGVTPDNVDQFLDGVDILIDGIDFFSIDERRLIFKKAREKGIYSITAGPLGFSSALLTFAPDGMSFERYFDMDESMSYLEKIIAFAVGLAPSSLHMQYINLSKVNPHSKQGPSIVTACTLCSSLAATEAISILLKRKRPRCAPCYFQFDAFLLKAKRGYLFMGNRNPLQRLKRWYLIKRFSKKT